MSRALDAVLGGWEVAGIYRYESGQYLRFGGMIAPEATPNTIGDVGQGTNWFDIAGFDRLPAFTRRANTWQYDDLKGPNYTNVDLSLSKRIPLTGNVKLNLRLEAYNLLNGMNWAMPSTTIGASDFGQVLQAGRRVLRPAVAVHRSRGVLIATTGSVFGLRSSVYGLRDSGPRGVLGESRPKTEDRRLKTAD